MKREEKGKVKNGKEKKVTDKNEKEKRSKKQERIT